MSPGLLAAWLVAGRSAGALVGTAWANGQVTHAWIAREAEALVADPDLRAFVSRDDLDPWIVHGAMFPDWGYAVDLVGGEGWERSLGEAAHWEPFQDAVLQVIRDRGCEAPFPDDCAPLVAFFLGLVSHGMADQVFDGFLYGWSAIYDAELGWAEGQSFDEASDVIWAAATDAPPLPEKAIPSADLVAAYRVTGEDQADEATLDDGMDLLRAAYDLVVLLSASPEVVSDYAADFPWGAAALQDPGVPGHPSHEALAVAGAWATWWARLTDAPEPDPVLLTWPPSDAPWGIDPDPSRPESRVGVVFTSSIDTARFDLSAVRVEDATGADVPVNAWVFYANVLLVEPLDPWREGATYTLVVPGDLPFLRGGTLGEDRRIPFGVGPAPAEEPTGCGCAALGDVGAPAGGAWLGGLVLAAWILGRRGAGPAGGGAGR